jgi:adenylate cyclase
VRPPTVLVKTLRDAVMLASEDLEHLLQAVVDLVAAVGALDGFPPIRAGVTHGKAHERSGDWYGDSVNLTSRVTKAADPGTVL